MLTEEERQIARKIGEYYLAKEGDYDKACDAIEKLGITNLELKDGKVCIKLARPGMFIGRRGENIDALQKYLGVKIHIVEDDLLGWLYPPYPDDWEERT